MRVLLDECLPRKLKRQLPGHVVRTVQEAGWAGKKNGELLRLAEREFDCFMTVDQNMRHQQTLGAFQLAVIVLVVPNSRLDTLTPLMRQVRELLPTITKSTLIRVMPTESN